MRIGVMGAGAIGCYLGARLAGGGASVTLIGRKRLVEAVQEQGLQAQGLDGKKLQLPASAITVSEDAGALAECEVVLVTVKSGQSEEAGRLIAESAAPGALIISFQNGRRNPDTLRSVVGDREVLAGMVPFNVVWEGPAFFRQTTSGALALERSDSVMEFARSMKAGGGGLPLELHDDIESVQWGKLILNLNNSINALSGVPLKAQLSDREYRRCLAATIAEALHLLKVAGIRPHSPLKAPLSWVPRVLRAPTPIFRLVAQAMLRVDPDARSSMWDDLDRGRKTEIDYLNGEFVELARERGELAPVNEAIVKLVKQAETREHPGSPELSAPALRAALGI
jgi:2-dehydropantoate 2-reductase